MIEATSALSIRRPCILLNVPRGRWYAPAAVESAEDLELKRLLDEEYLRHPFYGSRRMTAYLRSLGWKVNRKRVRRLLREMGLTAVGPKPNTRRRDKAQAVYPYRLRDVVIERVNQAWSADITYIPMAHGFAYLVAIVDWHSRKVLAWRIANTLDAGFCVDCLLPKHWLISVRPRFSTPIKAVSLPARRSPACSRPMTLRSAWMAADGL